MSDYTPTTDEVAEAWASRSDGEHTGATGDERRGYEAEFDRWLAQHDREVQAAAWNEGFSAATDAAPSDVWLPAWDDTDNPYRAARLTPTSEEPTT